ncbi:MAG: SH3 domain-containing protein [Caldilineaceae bacterium]|nr:SH3 domain-containing protein [Caldilineaceae bacterium]
MSPQRKQQADWNIKVKNCPLGHANHQDENYCVKCDFPFEDNPIRRRRSSRRFGSWAAFAVLIGLLISPLVFGITGWRPSAEPGTAVYQNTDNDLASRILNLERKVGWLEEELRSQAVILDGLTAKSATDPKPTSTVDLNPVPSNSVLVVQVEQGNVRSNPGINHPIIGTVTAGQIIEDVLGQHDNGWFQFCCVDGDRPGWLASSLVVLRSKADVPNQHKGAADAAPYRLPPLIQPPQDLAVDSFYQKHLNAGGVAVLAPESVSDEEMYQTAAVILSMLSNRPDLLAIMVERGFRVGIYNPYEGGIEQLPEFQDWEARHRTAGGFSASHYGSTVGIPELIHDCNPSLIHEFAHAIDYALQWQDYDRQTQSPNLLFWDKLETTYQNAMKAGLWQSPSLTHEQRYTSANKLEYWAQVVGYWFRPQAFESLFGLPNLAHYDPGAAQLVGDILGDALLPNFCQIVQFEIRGQLADMNNNPISDVGFSLLMWFKHDGYIWPMSQQDWISQDARTGKDGSFVIQYGIQKSLLNKTEDGLYFTLGAYLELDRAPECSVAGYVRRNNLVKDLWSAQSIELDGQDLTGLSIRVPRTFDWSPESPCS